MLRIGKIQSDHISGKSYSRKRRDDAGPSSSRISGAVEHAGGTSRPHVAAIGRNDAESRTDDFALVDLLRIFRFGSLRKVEALSCRTRIVTSIDINVLP